MAESIMRVPWDEVIRTLRGILDRLGMSPDRSAICAELFAGASRDGVSSHGLDRFPGFVRSIQKGTVKVDAAPILLWQNGAMERWDGQLGPGPLNARHCMNRAIALARAHAVGCVGLCRTNHWMRAGSYGWQAAEAGMIGICWTNTNALMPPWGSREKRVGNNPLVLAVPRKPAHLVLDMAMSQFSFGKLTTLMRLGQQTPVQGGFDAQGNPSSDPAAILNGGRALPIGCWKGVGLAVMLDIIAAAVSGGLTTCQITASGGERTVSQVFIAIDAEALGGLDAVGRIAEGVADDLHKARPLDSAERILYPGERVMETRARSMAEGVPVHEDVWRAIRRLPA